MIKSISHLEAVLGYGLAEIKAIIAGKEKLHYHFQRSKGIIKGKEEFRHFHPSRKKLRDIQNRIQTRIFSKIALPEHIQGGVKGRSNISNLKMHRGKLYKMHTDLKSFFDYVTNKMVYDALRDFGFSQKVSHWLTLLTTFRGHLAQGASTSPFLANIAALKMDRDMLELGRLHNITYSRYIDDLCFSSQADFKEHVPVIKAVIIKHKFLIGHPKTKYKLGRLEITGGDVGQNVLRPTSKLLNKYNDPGTPEHTRKGLDIYFAGLRKK